MAKTYRKYAKEVFEIESKAIADLSKNLDSDFDSTVETILKSSGRLVVSGVGKSGIIGKKISATLASTGTPSLFLNPVDAFHGDLGMIQKNDVFMAISYSGETEELLKLIPFIKTNKIKLIALSGNPKSTLAKNCDFHLNVSVYKEACPLELAPTSSTTATLTMGDALAVSLMKARNFKPEDFAQFHPGGSLGKKLLTRVDQVMQTKNLPIISPNNSIPELIETISKGRLGLAVIQDQNKILGIITDGDLRRAIDKYKEKLFALKAKNIMTEKPKTISSSMKLSEAEELMSKNKITSLLVVEKNKLAGIIQLYTIKND